MEALQAQMVALQAESDALREANHLLAAQCEGQGHCARLMEVGIPVPPGTAHGERLRFAVTPRRGPRTRVDVRVMVETGR